MRLIIGLILVSIIQLPSFGQAWKVDVKVNGYTDSVAYLAYRWGNKQYYSDTAVVSNETFGFQGDKLQAGIYMVVGLKNNYMFEFVIDEQESTFSVETDTAYTDFEFSGAPANQAFKGYGQFVNERSTKAMELSESLQASTTEEEKQALQDQLDAISSEVKDEQERLISTYSGSLVAYIMRAQQDIEVPEAPETISEDKAQEWRYRYYKRNFWSKFDFDDERIVFTPVYFQKLNNYFDNLVVRDPDSVLADVDHMLGMLTDKKEFYKQTFVYLYERYNTTKIICMDKVYVQLALKWYTPELAWWANDNQINKIQRRAREIRPSICGNPAPNMRLLDTTGTWHELYQKDWEHTVLYFWDPDCGHCKKATPEMIKVYHRYKAAGVEFFAVGGAQDTKEWRAFIDEHGLDWLNVTDNMEDQFLNNFRDKYDIYAYPKVFVLDKDKTILIKSLSADQLDKYLNKGLELQPDNSFPAPKVISHE
jgi:peroxiredoxin